MEKLYMFDSTLRDGAQSENVTFSVEDKLNIVRTLDEFGIDYIEAGNPASNPKDLEFFKRIDELKLSHAKLVAFGSTRRRGVEVAYDKGVQSIVSANTEAVAIFGKAWDMHVTKILGVTLEENLAMIEDTVAYFAKLGKEVIFDAEHFFDGYKENPEYALKALKAAERAGASWVVLCETNGGCMPDEVYEITKVAREAISVPVGIHCHNDSGCAVANSIMAVKAGATQVQGTFIGIGERCGNANLSTVIAGAQLKLGFNCVPVQSMPRLTSVARYIAEVANISISDNMPYVGKSAFAHKGGMHVDGVSKCSRSFEHIEPQSVGNERNILISEVAGRTAILMRLSEVDPTLTKESPETQQVIDMLKQLEHEGYQFEAADASFELRVLKQLKRFKSFFEIENFKIIGEKCEDGIGNLSSALIKIKVGEQYEITASEGNGPVNAIDKALRKALEVFYPSLGKVRLIDYKVRVMNTGAATAATTRVLMESTDGEEVWTTVGASADIINASMVALVDSMEYKLYKELRKHIIR
ncbi:MAG TPA: citramalate synthase [Oscillospiraceae bacterium]|nr:citramalate synthase [Oscillospiraceae bacterium]